MYKEIDFQVKAVKELVEKTKKLLLLNGNRKTIVFEAPTGSGKTVTATKTLCELSTELENEGKEVAFIWIAPNKLHLQSCLSMQNFFSESKILNPILYEGLDHSINGYIHANDVFFINWASINKDDNIIVRETEQNDSIFNIIRRTREKGLYVVVIIDEEHEDVGTQAKKVLEKINANVELRISATPRMTNPDDKVFIPRHEVIKAEIIKEGITINPSMDDIAPTNISANAYLLQQALQRREEIKQAYDKLKVNINPLLLIQLPNDDDDKLSNDEQKLVVSLKELLDTKYGINTHNGKLAIWLSKEKINLENISDHNNLVEVLLFKQAIALGWDCPRAAVLLIFRNIKSHEFGTQTVGRILRMPEQKHYTEEILNRGWVYTNISSNRIVIKEEDYLSKTVLVANLRTDIKNVSLPSVYSEYLSMDRNRIGSNFKKVLFDTFYENWFGLPVVDEDFENESVTEIDINKRIEQNRKNATSVANIDFSKHDINIEMIKDVDITGGVETIEIDEEHKRKFNNTQKELEEALTNFCSKLITGFEQQSAIALRNYLYELLEEELGISETDAPYIILYDINKPKFEDIIRKAIEKYKDVVSITRAKAKTRDFKEYFWELPQLREYKDDTHSIDNKVKNHALLPYYRLKNASEVEKNFEEFLEKNTDYIAWWYKNGDSGKQHYAISYDSTNGTKALFYVDYIIMMKNGQVFLFDTKSKDSDTEAPNKHNALRNYIDEHKNKNLQGGIIIQDGEGGNWYFCEDKIENTHELEEWTAFFPDKYKE